jgi:hypothetical protein
MLVNPRWIRRNPHDSYDFDFERILQSAFTAKDNPYLANTFYQYGDGEMFSALDRVNYLWYLMFSGFAPGEPENQILLSSDEPSPFAPDKSEDHAKIDLSCVAVAEVQLANPMRIQQKRLKFSWDRFLANLPNPNMIFTYSKGWKSIRMRF